MAEMACVDLFCGAGGLTHGLISEGIKVVAGIDVDEACRHPFETNNAALFIKEDVGRVSPKRINKLFSGADIRILAGCAPCQPFSTYAQRYDVVGSPRWGLLYQFARLIKSTRPELVTMENVPAVTKHAVFDDFVEALRKLGYWVHQDVVDCTLYGLPQSRRRMVLLASLIGPIELIGPTHERPATVRGAIRKLPSIRQGTAHPKDPLHSASKLSELNLKRIRASRPGGTWRDWPKDLVAECHRRETGHTYPGVYGRMAWDEPAPTLTTQFYGFGNGRFGHPTQDRAISLREGAILQGFPPSYSFVPEGAPIHFKALGRMIGNAVPVTLGKVIGQSISAHLGIKPERKNSKKGGIADVARKPLVA
ncbi:MAG: DNA cytosine methyltransferase [Bradyrhizobium sp.]|uniref:DNA cytosine methyltransferase n=1 Tax=Bradyrhizobium sp. TaxID=376 RepID=UPI003D0AB49F